MSTGTKAQRPKHTVPDHEKTASNKKQEKELFSFRSFDLKVKWM